jgi:hypothetical protein
MQSPGINTAPGLPIVVPPIQQVTVTAQRLAQSQTPQSKTPQPCFASVANNPNSSSNIKTGMAVGGGLAAIGALLIVGFPETEIAGGVILLEGGGSIATVTTAGSGFGELLAGISGLGDSGFIALNAGAYGTAVGAATGVAFTAPTCAGNGH